MQPYAFIMHAAILYNFAQIADEWSLNMFAFTASHTLQGNVCMS